MAQTLFDLTGSYLKLKELAEQGADEKAVMDTMESIDDDIHTKADGYAAVIKHLKGNVEMIKAEEKRLKAFKATHENTIKRMKENLLDAMKMTDNTSFKTNTNHFYVRNNQESLIVEHEDNIPKEYYLVEHKLDTNKLKEYLQKNKDETVDGVGLKRTESVIIQ